MHKPPPHPTRAAEQEALGAGFAAGGFPRIPPHDEPADCREAWLRGYDREQQLRIERLQHELEAAMREISYLRRRQAPVQILVNRWNVHEVVQLMHPLDEERVRELVMKGEAG